MNPRQLFSGDRVQEHLPGEPRYERPAIPILAVKLAGRAISVMLLTLFTCLLWPLYLLGALIWGWPPNVPRLWQVLRYLELTWTVRPPPPGVPLMLRCFLTLAILRKCATIPIWGLAWLIDEMLYGAALRATPVVAPLIEISAARSGSTQLARYLEEDPHLAAPSVLQAIFPYLWLWRLVPRTLGRFITREQVHRRIEAMATPEFLERHEGDPFRTDTFDGALYLAHLNHLAPYLGPSTILEDFNFAEQPARNRQLWERDFIELFDRIGRKTLIFTGPAPDGKPRRLFIKGHFLCAADALERRYPDGIFLTIIREPAPRLQSGINYLRTNPFDKALGPVPWAWLGQALAESESRYCEIEQAWFTRQGGARRCVLRFSEYVRDLERAMTKVYRECLDVSILPPHVPRQHTPRERTNYLLNRSLEHAGVDEVALNTRLAGYIAWCRGESREP